MKISIIFFIVLIAGISIVTSTSQASAARRESAITRCVAKAHRQYPKIYYDWGKTRNYVYEACMFNAGFPP